MIRALIADDEPLARERISRLLSSESDIQIVSQCRDGLETVTSIRQNKPDLAFLDIEMPEIDGLGILREIPPDATPVIIFTTAYDHYAIQAFEAHALDYLLKPFDEERFRRALQRAEPIWRTCVAKISQNVCSLLSKKRDPRLPKAIAW